MSEVSRELPNGEKFAGENSTPSPSAPLEKAKFVFEKDIAQLEQKDKFRLDFLRRLSDQKVWVPKDQRPPKHQTVIIFDWDDTLMYTSFLLHGRGGSMSSATTQYQLQKIEKAASDLLHTALELGHTFIITNAQEGWVEDCVHRYMPSLKQVLQKVRIISARSSHEAECPHLSQWKKRAFLELGRQMDKQTITNLVSVGDANYEMEAVHVLGQEFSRSLIKTVKLQESPTPEELMKELDLVVPKFKQIVEKGINMKIRLERRAK